MILVLANEANGPTEELINTCDLRITIPRIGNAESKCCQRISCYFIRVVEIKISFRKPTYELFTVNSKLFK